MSEVCLCLWRSGRAGRRLFRFPVFLTFLSLGLLPAGIAHAQGPGEAALRGHLVDAHGMGMAAAEVRLEPASSETPTDRRAERTGRTDGRGRFTLVGVLPGTYAAEVLLPGAMGWAGPVTVVLAPGEVREADLRIEGGSLALAGAADPGSESEDTAAEVLSPAAREATLAGGGAAQETTEAGESAAARTDGETGTSGADGLSYDGLPVTQNAQRADGVSAEQAFSGGPRGASAGLGAGLRSGFAQGAVRAWRVMPRTFSAQYGGAAGGVLVARSGEASGRLRGNVYLQTRQSGWAATNPFAVVTRYNGGAITNAWARPADSTVRYGGAVGTPVRLPGVLRGWNSGVFGAVEGQVRSMALLSTPLTANFYALTAEQRALLGTRGVGAGAIDGALRYLDGLTGQTTVRSPREIGFARWDGAPGRADRLSLTAQGERGSAPATGGGALSEGVTDRALASVGARRVSAEAYGVQWQRLLSARAANSLRFQVVHDLQFETPPAPSAAEPAVGPGGYAPQVAIAPEGFVYGTPAALGRVAYPDEHRVEAADTLSLRLGRHLLTLGGDWSRVQERVLSATNLEGAFLYDSGTTGGHDGGLVDWITDYTFNVHAYPNGGCPSVYAKVHYFCFRSYAQSFAGAPTEFVTHQVAGFVEDSVRPRPDLRVSFGVRYDYLLLPFPQAPNAALDAVLRTLGGPAAGVTSSFPEDRNNVGPRVSVRWAPRRAGGLTLQAGYGMFFGRLPGATISAALAETGQVGSTRSIRITPAVETACPQVANQGFGYPCAFLSAPTGVVGKTASALVFSQRFRLPAVQRGVFGVEREVGRQLLVKGEYTTAWTTQLPESVDVNVAPSTGDVSYVLQGGDRWPGLRTGETFHVPLYTARRTALYGPVTALVSNANATYHSGTAEVRLRDWHGWGLRASYTYAKAIDYSPQSSPAPRQDGQFDPFANGYDKGLSSLDFPHHFGGAVSFRGDLRTGPAEVRAVLSGWRFAATAVAGSGAPYSYVVFGGTRLPGGHESINGSGGAAYLPTVGRNTLRLPARGVVNVRSARELGLGGRVRLTVQAEAFNALNSVSLSRVETRAFLLGTASGGVTPLVFQDAGAIAAEGLTTPAFGTALSSTTGLSRERQLEMGARLSF